uniref:Uncharacterized protein n=1 Tax=Arundo donax TaxID=35708 RepID=A0A0A9E163_ARUDO
MLLHLLHLELTYTANTLTSIATWDVCTAWLKASLRASWCSQYILLVVVIRLPLQVIRKQQKLE